MAVESITAVEEEAAVAVEAAVEDAGDNERYKERL